MEEGVEAEREVSGEVTIEDFRGWRRVVFVVARVGGRFSAGYYGGG